MSASSLPSSSSSGLAEMLAVDSHFSWRLQNFGLLFQQQHAIGATLNSKEFVTQDGEDTHRWCLSATCSRLSPQSMVRVNVRLVNLNAERVAGRYALRCYFVGDRRAANAVSLLGEGDDGIDRRDLMEVPPTTDSSSDHHSLFVGWAGAATEYSTKVVRAHIRSLRLSGDSRLVLPVTMPVIPMQGLSLDARMTAFVSLLYLKLTENIRRQLEQGRKVRVSSAATQTEQETSSPVNWESVSRAVLLRVLEVVRRYQKERAADALALEDHSVTSMGIHARETRV